jgi:hypothetical protein
VSRTSRRCVSANGGVKLGQPVPLSNLAPTNGLTQEKIVCRRSEEAPKLDDFLCFAIYSTNPAVNRVYKPLLDELGITYPQYIVLIALYDEDDQTVGGLGDKLFLDSSTLTPMLKGWSLWDT